MIDKFLTHNGYGDEYLKVLAYLSGFYICINYSSSHDTYNHKCICEDDIGEYTVHVNDIYCAFVENGQSLMDFLKDG
ncbi:MAG: hypothetical protein ACRC92_26375 [Peptostreptococcaceae bacterium]